METAIFVDPGIIAMFSELSLKEPEIPLPLRNIPIASPNPSDTKS